MMKLTYKFSLFLTIASFAPMTFANTILAIVNDTPITENQIFLATDTPLSADAKRELLERRIDFILQQQEVQKANLAPSEQHLNRSLAGVALENGLSFEEFSKRPDFARIRRNILTQMSIEALRSLVIERGEIIVNDNEIDTRYREENRKTDIKVLIKLAVIAIRVLDLTNRSDDMDSSISAFLNKLYDDTLAGGKFAELAKLYSQDPSFSKGGEGDWQPLNQLPIVWRSRLEEVEVGQLVKPFKSGNQWYLVKVIGKRGVDLNRETVAQELLEEKQAAYLEDWVRQLRQRAYIEIYEHKF